MRVAQDHGPLYQMTERLLKVGGERGITAVTGVQEPDRGRKSRRPAGGDRMAVEHRMAHVQHHVDRVAGIGARADETKAPAEKRGEPPIPRRRARPFMPARRSRATRPSCIPPPPRGAGRRSVRRARSRLPAGLRSSAAWPEPADAPGAGRRRVGGSQALQQDRLGIVGWLAHQIADWPARVGEQMNRNLAAKELAGSIRTPTGWPQHDQPLQRAQRDVLVVALVGTVNLE